MLEAIYLWELKGIRTELFALKQDQHDELCTQCGDKNIKEWNHTSGDKQRRYIGRFVNEETIN